MEQHRQTPGELLFYGYLRRANYSDNLWALGIPIAGRCWPGVLKLHRKNCYILSWLKNSLQFMLSS
jgi:hypothetical protein